MSEDNDMDLEQRIDAIESAYEFMFAYAAQGRQTDRGGGAASDLRDYLRRMENALEGLGEVVAAATREALGDTQACKPFLEAVSQDAERALAIIRLVLSKPAISSLLIDNVNGSIHLRALLTDLFVIDESLKQQAE